MACYRDSFTFTLILIYVYDFQFQKKKLVIKFYDRLRSLLF
jgi:hypothetical protein